MPEDLTAPRDVLGQTMAESRKVLVPYMAELLKTNKIAEVPPDEERRRFWTRAKTSEQEAQLWSEAMQQRGLTPETMTPEQAVDIGLGVIGPQVYPDRFDMMPQEGRDTQADQARWAWKHLKAGPPKAMTEGEQDVS